MEMYLEYSDDLSKKFWSIATNKNTFTVMYGKIGTAGQSQIKTFASAEEAEKEAQKLANTKMKKGYQPAAIPQGFGAGSAPSKTVKPKSAVKEKVLAQGPAPVADDGKLKPWQDTNCEKWQYISSWIDEESFSVDAITKGEVYTYGNPIETAKPTTPAYTENKVSEPIVTEHNFIRKIEYAHDMPHEELVKLYEQAVSAGVSNKTLMNGISICAKNVLRWRLALDGAKNYCFSLQKGAKYTRITDNKYAEFFCDEYEKVNDPTKAPEIFERFLTKNFDKMTLLLENGLRETVKSIKSGRINENTGVKRVPSQEQLASMSGLKITASTTNIDIEPICRITPWESLFYEYYEPFSFVDNDIAKLYMPLRIKALIEKLDNESVFDDLPLPTLTIKYGVNTLFYKVLNQNLLDQRQEESEQLVCFLEETTAFSSTTDLLKNAMYSLLVYPMHQDIIRASALLSRYLYSLDKDAEEAAVELLNNYKNSQPQFLFDLAMWRFNNFDYNEANSMMEELCKKGYEPAIEKCAELEKILYPSETSSEIDSGKKSVDFDRDFTEADVFIHTSNIIARADKAGNIRLRFIVEGEKAYSEALEYLIQLLQKNYARLNKGYSLFVRFLIKPEFIKQLPKFPKTTCHAFFARAVQYPALQEKVSQYAELSLVEFDWYKDLYDEDNTVPGTFAACALAFCDEKYIGMAGLYARTSDNEHQYIQLELAVPLLKKYGPVPEVAKAIFDICSSNGQEGSLGRLPKELYLLPENLTAIFEHIDSGTSLQHHLAYHFTAYVEAIMGAGNTKNNLKKLKTAALAASPDDQSIFVNFYNSYKAYASERDGEDYGEDLNFTSTATIVELPQYNEGEPVVMLAKDFKSKYPDRKVRMDNFDYQYRTIYFVPDAIDNPYVLDYMNTQWKLLKPPFSLFWGADIVQMDEWVINLTAPAKECGAIFYDGKTKPMVLYGLMSLAPLFSSYRRKPFKNPEEAEKARLSYLISEADDFRPIPESLHEALEKFRQADNCEITERYYASSIVCSQFTPADGRIYAAALMQLATIAVCKKDKKEERAVYEKLLNFQPQFADYWKKKIEQVGKNSR